MFTDNCIADIYLPELLGFHQVPVADDPQANKQCFVLNSSTGSATTDIVSFSNGICTGSSYSTMSQATKLHSQISRDCPGLFIVTSGYYQLTSNNSNIQASAGDIIVRGTNSQYDYQCLMPADVEIRGVRIDFPDTLLQRWKEEDVFGSQLLQRQRYPIASSGFRQWQTNSPKLLLLAKKLQACDIQSTCGQLEFESLSLAVLQEFFSTATELGTQSVSNTRRNQNQQLSQARDILHAEWHTPPTISQLARRVGMNECYLKSGFKDNFDSTIGRYVRTIRMHQAKTMITNQGYSVQQAAFETGFTNLSHFSRSFKTEFGVLPSVLRQ